MTVISLQDKLTASGASIGNYLGAQTAASFGNPAAEFRALWQGCGFYDMSWQAKLVLTGEDRVRWLNGMVTNNVRDLPVGHGVYCFLLTAQGRIVADLVAYNRGDHLLVASDRSQAPVIAEMFDRYIVMDDVEVADVSHSLSAVGVSGPGAPAVLRDAGIVLPQLAPGQVVDLVWRELGISVARGVHPGLEAYDIWVAAQQIPTVWDALTAAGATPVGSEAFDWFRMARGVPRYGLDLTQRDLPQETGQKHALNFAKGCYLGQEIVERIRARAILHRTFRGFLLPDAPPPPGTPLERDGKKVGEITSSARVPFPAGERTIALGYLRREFEAPGTVLQAGGQQAVVHSVPFEF